MVLARLSSKFQLSIPKAIRENLQLKEGQQFVLVECGHIIELIPAQSLQDARGFLTGISEDATTDYRDRSKRNPI